MKLKSILIVSLLVLSIFLLAACSELEIEDVVVEDSDLGGSPEGEEFVAEIDEEIEEEEAVVESDDEVAVEESSWLEIELSDVSTGETFTLSQFDAPVILESFAVWCPTCTKQQEEIKLLHESVGDAIVSVGLDTDPHEDEGVVLEHVTANNFDWRYAVAPVEMTEALIDEFGFTVVNAPSAPIVVICENGEGHLLESGVKSAARLEEAVGELC